jgi:GNAT superfamily N-acetyltransferase
MSVRPADENDTKAVEELLAQLGYSQPGHGAIADRIRAFDQDPSCAVFVAEADSEVVGVIAVHVCPFFEHAGSWARIVALVVSDRSRSHGIGTELVAAAESFAAGRGCLRMEVTSSDHRTAAHAFYRRRGYVDQEGTSSRFLRDLPG